MKTTTEELLQILEEGEGYLIEFKESLTTQIDKELVAFANASGGRIVLGVSDSGKIKGIKITNELKSRIQDVARNCQPAITIIMEDVDNVLVVKVREGRDKPYHCSSGFYTRVGPNCQKLKRDDIQEFFQNEGKVRFDELMNMKFDFSSDFSEEKLNQFLVRSNITKLTDTPSILINLGVAEKQDGQLLLNNTGVFFFAKNLAKYFLHTVITCALYEGKQKVNVADRRDFNEDIISNIEGALLFLKRYLAVRYHISSKKPQRDEIHEIPYEALREAIVNAVAHRNYFEKGANVMVEIFDDRIEISSPGSLPKGLSLEEFGKRSVLRNPRIADLLLRANFIEKMGTGIQKINSWMKQAGLSPVNFKHSSFTTLVFRRPLLKVGEKVGERVGEKVGETTLRVLAIMREEPTVTITKLSSTLQIATKNIENHITKLKQLGYIQRQGSARNGYWEVIES